MKCPEILLARYLVKNDDRLTADDKSKVSLRVMFTSIIISILSVHLVSVMNW